MIVAPTIATLVDSAVDAAGMMADQARLAVRHRDTTRMVTLLFWGLRKGSLPAQRTARAARAGTLRTAHRTAMIDLSHSAQEVTRDIACAVRPGLRARSLHGRRTVRNARGSRAPL